MRLEATGLPATPYPELDELLARRSGIEVGAIDRSGFFVELPAPLDRGHRRIGGETPLDLIVPGDVPAVVAMWERLLVGTPVTVEVRRTDGRSGVAHGFDLTERHGVHLIVMEVQRTDTPPVHHPVTPDVRRRVCRMSKDRAGIMVDVDEAATYMFGFAVDALIGHAPREFMHVDDFAAATQAWMRLLREPGGMQGIRARHRCKDGSYLWVEIINHNLLDDPEHGCVRSELVDISEQVAAEHALAERQAALAEREELLSTLTDALPSGVLQARADFTIELANARTWELLGAEPTETLRGLTRNVVPQDRHRLDEAAIRALEDGTGEHIEVRVVRPHDREVRTLDIVMRALTREHGDGQRRVIASITDVTDTVRRRTELEARAATDPLTGCLNRASVLQALDQALARSETVGVVFVDLDKFKAVNDDLGHSAGDEMLRVVAERLQGAVRAHDVVGRLGGDEFLVVCPSIGRLAVAEALVQRLARAVFQPARILDHTVTPGASFGLAWTDEPSTSAAALLEAADRSMYEDKRSRRATTDLSSV